MKAAAIAVAIVVFVVLLSCYTPRSLSNLSWRMKLCKAYKIDGETGFRVIKYFHDKTDGHRLKHDMQTKTLPRMVHIKKPPEYCQLWTRVKLPRTKLEGSSFLRLVTVFLSKTRHIREMRQVSTSIVVSTRYKLTEKERFKDGCFLRMAFTTVRPDLSLQGILDAHSSSIQSIRAAPALVDSLADRAYYTSTNYTFNKWMLNTIELADGRNMRLHHGGARIRLKDLLAIKFPLDIKCIAEGDDVWTLLVNPYFYSIGAT